MNRCGTLSSAKAASTNARRGLLVALGEAASNEPQQVHSGEATAPNIWLANMELGNLMFNH